MPFAARQRKPLKLSRNVNHVRLRTDKGTMLTRRTMILGAAGAAIVRPAMAADPAATAFVQAIYATYIGKDAKGVALDKDATIRRYFEPSLAALMIKDAHDAARKGDAPNLDGDPFIDAQDWDIKNFDIAVSDDSADKATATVKFVNVDKPQTVVLALIKLKDGWRIHDITWQHDGKPETLRDLYVRGMYPR
jgi:hypothetical protein